MFFDDMFIAFPHQQQEDESNIDFKRFEYYLSLGASRSLKKVSDNFGITPRRVEQISSKNHWTDRIKAINNIMNEQVISEIMSQIGETARDLSDKIKPIVFKILDQLDERDLSEMNPTELKGVLDVCYKIIAQIYGIGTPQVQVNQIEYPEIKFKWDWDQDDPESL